MNKNPMLLALVGAAIVGIIAVITAAIWLSSKTEEKQVITIVQSAVDIEAGTKLAPEQLTAIALPPGSPIPQGAIFNAGTVVNRLTKVRIVKGENILENMLVPITSSEDLSNDIPLGKRAFTIGINEISGVGGFASPGNYVDVIVSVKDGAALPISKTVVENVRVMAVAQSRSITDLSPKVGTTVTLEVTPEQAQKLDVARSLGTLSLTLRNRADKTSYAGAAASKNDLALTPNVYNDSASIEIIRGNIAPGSSADTSVMGGAASAIGGLINR
ncbi:Flp pilus assembly protein CpaB [Polynucleobacter sp. MWH-Braz-FAM2G]|uniref:Flp pilus assembly protein CpaB n=1 Tax=Polynucleobacter sp. MWH-Braz-FAM2G TaxID=1855883 RepID=UPI001BFE6AF6|nr:Flp pilus assembly protein CpaB [Polynucleobacter sp. MWH-Braz-FAM2G]QWD89949.1 Flp pilus assembly protein CpaB [Polynucleobacter sp. MWH-Braz-FAM2G]